MFFSYFSMLPRMQLRYTIRVYTTSLHPAPVFPKLTKTNIQIYSARGGTGDTEKIRKSHYYCQFVYQTISRIPTDPHRPSPLIYVILYANVPEISITVIIYRGTRFLPVQRPCDKYETNRID